MADAKISALTELAEAPADTDELAIVDKSDTTDAATGTTKRLTAANVRSGLVPSSIVDAKGDLIVASAADTVVRLPVGTDDHVLTADAAEVGGVKWAAAAAAGGGGGGFSSNTLPALDAWRRAGFLLDASATEAAPATRSYCASLVIDAPCRVTGMAVRVTTAGGAGAVCRLGLWSGAAGAVTLDLLADAGTVDTTSTGIKEITGMTVDMEPGVYWASVTYQVAGCTLKASATGQSLPSSQALALPSGTITPMHHRGTGFSGALGSSTSLSEATTGSMPLVAVQIGVTP